jgi:16S rRNA A1518/A1519 N6-dimethyltransferase RsmA/KsgA/DIM1 with predicted DNA glycosylase/AP lyase activity
MEDSDFAGLTIDPGARAETLSIADFVAIAVHLYG